MGKSTVSQKLDASIEQAFDYVSTVDQRPEWQKSLVDLERLTPLPDGEGTHWRETFMIGGKPSVGDMRYSKIERPTLFVEDCKTAHANGTIEVHFRDLGDATMLTANVSLRWKGFYRLLGPILDHVFKRTIEKDFGHINDNLIALYGRRT